MKVTVSVISRFHAFNLAHELHRQDMLAQLITSYPRFEVMKYGIPREMISTVLSNELMRRTWTALPRKLTSQHNPQLFFCDHFDNRAAQLLTDDCDLFVGWSGNSLECIKRARALGMSTIVERGSSHILYQQRELREEYERFGLEPKVAHPGVVEKELAEYASADFISIPSHFVRRSFEEHGIPAQRLIHVPYGVSLDEFTPPDSGTREADPTFRILHVGKINLRKGCHYLLQAFHELQLPDSELVLVGEVAPELEPFQRKYAAPNVVYEGAVPQQELVSRYGRAHVFCLASIEEGLAMVMAQAMACGLPVVASTNTGAEDLVRDGQDGFVVPTRDVEAMKAKLAWLYENREACSFMGSTALEHVRQEFTWHHYGDRVARAYGRAMALQIELMYTTEHGPRPRRTEPRGDDDAE